VAVNKKKIIFHIIAVLLIFSAGFFTRSLFDRQRVSGTDEHYKNIQSELRRAEESNNELETYISGAGSAVTSVIEHSGAIRSGIVASIEHSGIIADGIDGIEKLTVENTDLLGRAERILLEAGGREQKPKE
jgi:hypothetical protein